MSGAYDLPPKSKRAASPYDLPSEKVGGSPYDLKRPTKADMAGSVEVLQQQVDLTGAPVPAQDSPGLFRRTLDLLMRGNYAAAGAAEEAFAPQGGGITAVPGRVANELLSGIGGFKGQKEGFAQVMEQAGVGQLGSLSDIAPWLYSETGKGLPLEKGGLFDVTGRGAIGFVGDVALDPVTYITAGAKGIGIGGKFLPGSAKALAAVSDATKSTIKAVPAFDHALDAVGAVFNRDWKIRNLPGAVRLKQAHLNRQNYETAVLFDTLQNSKIAAIPKSLRADFVNAMDNGSWATKYANDPKMLEAAQEFKTLNEGFAKTEVEHGLLNPKDIRENYAAHFYDNSNEELNKVVNLWPTANVNKATLGRHKELRAFDTLDQAEAWSKAQHAIDPSVPILKPVRDPLEILRRRGEASIEAVEFNKYYDEIKKAFGREDVPFSPEDFFDLTKAVPVTDGEASRIAELIAKGKTPVADFAKLSEQGKKEFVRNRLLATKEPPEVLAVLRKYGTENAPAQKKLIGTLAPDGTPYVSVNAAKLKGAQIPKSMADDLADMSERAIKSQELNHLLTWYDKSNNIFKGFVTVLFPAFHARNAYSNLAQGFADVGMSVLNPARHFDAVSALRGAEGDLVTKAGERIPYKVIKQEMAENGVTTTGRRLAEYTGTQGMDRLSTVGGKIKAAPRAFGAAIENEARAALYTVYRRRGMDVPTAAEQVNKFLFDYTNLSRVEQDFFRRAIPFYTWQRKNLERQFMNIATKPGLTAAELKPFRGREDENGMLTSWDAEALKVRLNRDGKTLRVLSGVDLPVRGLDFVWNGNLRGTLRQNIGMLSPMVKAPLEIGFGVNAFTGKTMDRQTSNSVGRIIEEMVPVPGVRQWLGYAKETDAAGRPKYTFDGERFYILFQSWALSRMVSTTDRQFKTFTESPEWSRVMLDTLTGLRDKTLNLDDEQAKKMAERKRQLEESLIRWGQRKRYTTVYKPKGQP
jgi:hypothetical protein